MIRNALLVKLFLFVSMLAAGATVFSQTYSWTPLLHNNSGNGVNGNIHAIVSYQNNIVAAGGFSTAGGVNARNIAVWNGITWSPLGSGIGSAGDTVYALAVFNNELYAGGSFSTAGGVSANNIAKWNGSSWSALGSGADGSVHSLTVFNSVLVVGGTFESPGNLIASWNGTTWQSFGPGFTSGSVVYALAIFNGQLTAAGRFQQSVSTSLNNIAVWSGSSWQPLGSGVGTGSDRVYALTVLNNTLIAGGRFSVAGGIAASNIARWTGSIWQNIGNANDLDDDVRALGVFNSELVAGGNFRFVSGVYASKIVKWTGSSWSRMVTGMDDMVEALCIKDTSLYAGGENRYSGGFNANGIARWFSRPTNTISGSVTYSDNGQPVANGYVKSYRIDSYTKELIVVDSIGINAGTFILPHNTHDTMRVIAFPNDEFDFCPTHYPSALDWTNATVLVPNSNLININIVVYRVTPSPMSSGTISGHIYLNLNIPGNPPGSYPYERDAILYVKQGSSFMRFAVSREDNSYITSILNPGNYDLYVYRAGYHSAFRSVTIGTGNLDTINFTLDTMNVIGLENISTRIPSGYKLEQNYPNPFNPSTAIRFSLPDAGRVTLSIFNVLGQRIAEPVDAFLQAGEYIYRYDAAELPSGIYFYTLSTDRFNETRKMVLIK